MLGRPLPVGFPGCRLCPMREVRDPLVCLGCLELSAGQVGCGAAPPGACCAACGQHLPERSPCPTGWCARRDRGWSVLMAVGSYAGGLRRAIVRYKYAGEGWWAEVLALVVAGFLDRNAGWVEEFDMIVPVPAYTGPGARRAWDPVGAVAERVASLAGTAWPVERAVVKVSETEPMSGRGARQRRATASGPLRRALRVADPAAVAGARVLVLDDVFAEGSTLREVALALRRAGAAEVAGLVVARPPWGAEAPRQGRGRPGRL